jgi:type 1 glutamine amidotransferase
MSTAMLQKFKVYTAGLLLCLGLFSFSQAKQQASQFKVLAFYTPYAQMGDKAHSAYALEANTWFPTAAAANGFTYESSTNFGDLNATKLAGYKVIMFLDNYPGDGNQRTALQTYVTNGGGFIGFHVSAFNQNPAGWSWYFSTFLAMGSYKNNTWAPTTAVLAVEDTTFVITKGFPKKFTAPVNEWYAWNNDLRQNANIKVLCSIHTDSYPLGTGTGSGGASEIWQNNGEYRPIIWTNKNFKMLYSNIGHDDVDYGTGIGKTKTFSNAQYDTLVIRAIKYCAGVTTSIEGEQPVARNAMQTMPGISIKTDVNFIHVCLENSGNILATMSDAKGRIVHKTSGTSGVCRIERSNIKSGIYFIKVQSSSGVLSRTICLN